MKRRKAVVLLSGGIDSSTTLAVAKSESYELYALSFDYNQRHKREIESAQLIAQALGAKQHLIIHFDLRGIGGSALTSDVEVPKRVISNELQVACEEKDLSVVTYHSSLIPVTYVPARNTIFLSFALGWAEVLESEDIFIGANSVDYSGYPDCRPEYLRAFEDMANLATRASVENRLRFVIRAPLVSMRKSEIIKKGVELGLNYSLTWSCYDPQKNRNTSSVMRNGLGQNTHHASRITHHDYVPCGLCESCVIRARGFKEAAIKDPLIDLLEKTHACHFPLDHT
jgi:7-cyano-7-deazaguanine synthase